MSEAVWCFVGVILGAGVMMLCLPEWKRKNDTTS